MKPTENFKNKVLLEFQLISDSKSEHTIAAVIYAISRLLVHLSHADVVAHVNNEVVIELIAETNRNREVELFEFILARLVKV